MSDSFSVYLMVGSFTWIACSFSPLQPLSSCGRHRVPSDALLRQQPYLWNVSFIVCCSVEVQILLTHPLIFTLVVLVMNLLLNDVLVSRIVRVENLDGLPAALALVLVLGLECQTSNDNSQSQTLSVDTSLNELLLTTKVRVAADNTESSSDGSDPRTKDDTVTVLISPLHCAFGKRLLRLELVLEGLLLIGVALLGMAGKLELARVAIGLDDGGESTSTGDQESTEW